MVIIKLFKAIPKDWSLSYITQEIFIILVASVILFVSSLFLKHLYLLFKSKKPLRKRKPLHKRKSPSGKSQINNITQININGYVIILH